MRLAGVRSWKVGQSVGFVFAAIGILLAAGSAYADVDLTVRLYDTAAIPAGDLATAQAVSTAIFAAAGVTLTWLNCASADPQGRCGQVPEPSSVIVRVVPQESPIDNALGDSMIDAASHKGTLATLFAGNIRAMASRTHTRLGLLLGRAMAHEIDHVLLGSTTHSAAGLMRAHWYDDELANEKPSDWVLAADDAKGMLLAADARLHGTAPIVSDVAGSGGDAGESFVTLAPPNDLTR